MEFFKVAECCILTKSKQKLDKRGDSFPRTLESQSEPMATFTISIMTRKLSNTTPRCAAFLVDSRVEPVFHKDDSSRMLSDSRIMLDVVEPSRHIHVFFSIFMSQSSHNRMKTVV